MFLLFRVLSELGRGGRRERDLARLDAEAARDSREAMEDHPCPLCGSPSVFHRYPHIEVWRCSRFPECRGFTRARKQKRPAFALKWESGRGRSLKG